MGCPGECNEGSIAAIADRINVLEAAMLPFTEGHPLLALQEASDVALFDATSGWGSGRFTGWAKADGTTYTHGAISVVTYDMRDKVPTGSGLTYTVGQVFGEASHVLISTEMPVHTHTISDPGHDHNVTDPGHTHAHVDAGHTHAASQVAHSHSFTTASDGAHTHQSIGSVTLSDSTADETVPNLNATGASFTDHLSSGAHTHSGTTDSATPAISVVAAATGISNVSNTTGINQTDSATTGITLGNAGSGVAHNNIQPSVGTLWVQKIY